MSPSFFNIQNFMAHCSIYVKMEKGPQPGKFSLTAVLLTFRTVSKPKLSRAVTYITAASEPDTR